MSGFVKTDQFIGRQDIVRYFENGDSGFDYKWSYVSDEVVS